MNSDDLMIFLAVAEEGAITKAASRLGYVQSNVTARVQQLESDLHTPLFHRHSRGMTMTAAGKTLFGYAQRVRHLLQETRLAVQDSPIPKGALTIGSLETTAAVRLPRLLAAYHRAYPEVDVSLVTGPTEYLVEQVLRYKADGAFVSGPIDHPDLYRETSFPEELMLVSEPTALDMHTLGTKPLLAFHPGCSYRSRLEQWVHSEGILFPKIMEFGTLEAIVSGVSAGLGISLLPKSVTVKLEAQGILHTHALPDPYGSVQTVFIRRADLFITSAFREFVKGIPQHIDMASAQSLPAEQPAQSHFIP